MPCDLGKVEEESLCALRNLHCPYCSPSLELLSHRAILEVVGIRLGLRRSMDLAAESVDSGAAAAKLDEWVAATRR